jgi:predicted permease
VSLRAWYRRVLRRDRTDRDLAAEIEFHLQARIDHWRQQGLTPTEASRRARLEFGGVEHYKEECRQHVGLRLFDEWTADVRYGARRLVAAPAFTLVAVTILAVAIGANTAIFSVLETVMFKSLPVPRPQDLRELAWIQPRDSTWPMSYDGSQRPSPGGGLIATSFSYPVYEHVRDHSTAFSDLILFSGTNLTVGTRGREQRASGLLVSGNFLRGLGVEAELGRPLTAADDVTGAPAVVMLGHAFWQRAFGGRSDVVGQAVSINGVVAVVTGITPAGFYGVEPGTTIDVFAPVAPFIASTDNKGDRRADPQFWGFRVFGRLKPGATDAQAAAETEALVRQALPPVYANAPAGLTRVTLASAAQGLDSLRRNYAQPLYLLAAIMAFVLLIACGNVAGLLLIRTAARTKEIRLCIALGAGRLRVIRQLLVESLLLATVGAALGVGLAMIMREGVLPLINQEDGPLSLALGFDAGLAAFAVGLCLSVALLCGSIPAWRAMREVGALSTRAVGTVAGRSSRLFAGRTLILVQVSISMVLLASAGLFVRTVINLRSQPLGFRPDHVLLFQLDAGPSGYKDARLKDFYERVLDEIRRIPRAQSASMSRYALLSGGAMRDNITTAEAVERSIGVHVHFIAPQYFATMGIPVMAGRDVSSGDRESAPRVAIVNDALGRLLSGSTTIVGRRIRYDGPDPVDVVGLVGDARFASLREAAPPTVYLPYRQYAQHRMTFAIHTVGDPLALAEAARQAVARIDPDVPVFEVRTQESQLDAAMRQERLFAYVASGFALLALFVACLGIYGTLAYGVSRRTAEIGLRKALGANHWHVATMVGRESIWPVLVGIVTGTTLATFTTTYLESMLFGLSPHDLPTLMLAGACLLASALLAAWIPSSRASRVEPIVALRAE